MSSAWSRAGKMLWCPTTLTLLSDFFYLICNINQSTSGSMFTVQSTCSLIVLLPFGFVVCLDRGYLAPPCWKHALFQSVPIASFLLLGQTTALHHSCSTMTALFTLLLATLSNLSRTSSSVLYIWTPSMCVTVLCCKAAQTNYFQRSSLT